MCIRDRYQRRVHGGYTFYLMSEDSDRGDGGWIQWFCSLAEHQFFVEVDEDYIRDGFNLYGLKQKFPHYEECIEMILSPDVPEEEDLEDEKFHELYQEATDLYGLIHARFILSPRGLSLAKEKYLKGKFGTCPKVVCDHQHVLPVGLSEELRTSRVKVFCPRCEDIFIPKKKCPDVDGAYFGCSFPMFFLQTYPDLTPQPPSNTYVSKLYGFRIHQKKGSKFSLPETGKEITFYDEEYLKKIKSPSDSQKKSLESPQATSMQRDSIKESPINFKE
eukprot:TRINITY_DN3412_c0_g1_i4.p1 TRINITY_DN3412_c0_g1~~TRINITY_DN3412_c0_g1_i4.p1  ORF type:complete len:275 (+),score=37.30 TRINITY_DN3412_c0_g1_i4:65-889(+)